ncbi:LrgB family protein [Celeribacter halophilus]|uniref:TIGR00659 family protein n=1 Tax=Celeribacter halophilus TaxID=576117 RepID=A0A1I3SVJ2_9RHOB|nr:LrgB family protein [Celeribacter halophilus]PZX12100.1 putative murein hydrolase (TIGR00659 family) [Celeribacter halophilus]SFJ61869.1 TIGR00659 family protein [Celeribacter halophilus]
MTEILDIWSYLSEGPLLWLTVTIFAYLIGLGCFNLSGNRPVVNPVLISMVLLSALLELTDTSYATYFEGAQFVHFMLGPATVALAVPLWQNWQRIKESAIPMLAALFVGGTVSMISAVTIGYACGLRGELVLSLIPKAATSPVAIGVSEAIGGLPTLTVALVLITGVVGAIVTTPLLNALGIRDYRGRGLATGIAAHGIGTARAFQVHGTAGAFAGIGMVLNAIFTALIAPVFVHLFF